MTEDPDDEMPTGHVKRVRMRQALQKSVFNADYGIKHELPEHTLWAAVLVRAVADWIKLETRRSYYNGFEYSTAYVKLLREELLDYFEDTGDEPGSFIWTCQMISENHEALRESILKIIRKETHPDGHLRSSRILASGDYYNPKKKVA